MSSVVIGCVLIALIFLCSLMDASLGCVRYSRLRVLAEKGERRYEKLLKLEQKEELYRSSLRIALFFLEIFLGWLLYHAALPLLGAAGTLPAVEAALLCLAGSALVFVLARALPDALGLSAPERILAALFIPLKLIYALSLPLNLLGAALASLARRLLPPAPEEAPGMEDLRTALREGEKSGAVESEERTMVEGVLYLGERPVGTFMTHRSEVRWLHSGAGAEEAGKAAAEAGGKGCFPVADNDLDEVSGAVFAADILLALHRGEWPGLKALMKAPCLVPETMPALKAFEAFKKAETDCLFVMDEYGGFSGILSIRDLLEEIVGELSGGSGEEDAIVPQGDGVWLADGSVNLDDAAAALSLESLGGGGPEYHTLAGFILDLAGEIPKTGASFDYGGYCFKIAGMDGNRIDKVRISRV